MSTSTSNLGLFKYDPATDGADSFNLDTALNENWDKVDAAVAGKEGAVKNQAAKAAPANADSLVLVDSADGSKTKRLLWSAVKTALGGLFAAKRHKAQHAVGGADALGAADIGVADSGGNFDGATVEAALAEIASKAVRAAVLTYTGTGTYGSANPTVITLPFVPKLLYISVTYPPNGIVYGTEISNHQHALIPYDALIAYKNITNCTFYAPRFSGGSRADEIYSLSSDNLTLSFYTVSSAEEQFNASGYTYYVVLIGGGE